MLKTLLKTDNRHAYAEDKELIHDVAKKDTQEARIFKKDMR